MICPTSTNREKRGFGKIFTHDRSTVDLAYGGPSQGADVMPGYFQVLGIPLLEGRDFTENDGLDKTKVVLINRHLAETLFPGRSAVGEQIRWGNNDTSEPQIIGVVGNTKWNPAERTPGAEVYWSYPQYPSPQTHMLIRTSVPPEQIFSSVQRIIQEVNPDLAVERVKTLENIADESVWQRRLWSTVLSAFAGLALLLTAVGLYGVMSFLVTQRKREMGIRAGDWRATEPSAGARLLERLAFGCHRRIGWRGLRAGRR